ncbi:MAG: potassium channel family protein [Cryobacterium sp.]
MTQKKWQGIMEWPLIGASLLFLVVYAWSVIVEAQGAQQLAADRIIAATWIVFFVDYVVTVSLAEHPLRWFRSHLFDLLVVGLPLLRPLRLLRLITVLSVLQKTAGRAIRARVVTYSGGAALLLGFVAALAVLDAERSAPGASIVSFGDAVWWSITTLSTVGYGDYVPVTQTGRVVAAGLMLAGISILGVVTATLASWLVDRISEREQRATEDSRSATRGQVQQLSEQIAQLQARIDEGDAR